MENSPHARQVRDYYDRNTARFLRWGKDDGTCNLHAALWPPGVDRLAEAMHYSNELIAREIDRCPHPVAQVLDLGCGVGGSLFYLGRRLPAVRSFCGISLSPVQVARARLLIPEGLKQRCRFEEGSFMRLRGERFKTDFSFAIEAFAHGPDPAGFFGVQAGLLPPGGRLVIIDDCLSPAASLDGLADRHRRMLDRYRRNWLLPGLRTPLELRRLAEAKGLRLIADRDLTRYLRLGRPRDKAVSLLVKCLGPLMERDSYLRSLLGGDAKQACYFSGLIRYRLLVFENRTAREVP
ncbi:MAG: methyltransferase domain-containing protein [Desulfobacterales bacterium]|jgi:SAM-dependent methyltransferase|nr:methyltransferase domain-containing protein [Desulfobacterales bacterium]